MSTNEASTKKKTRSPNYPAISLAEAVSRVNQIYERENVHAADSNTLAIAMGYSGSNGASDQVISALKKYGLLENAGNREYKLSEGAIDIYHHPKGHEDRIKAIVSAAFTPPLFAELHDEYGNILPSENNLRVKLIKKGYNPKSVDDVIRAYRDTLELVSEEAPAYNAAVAGKKEDVRPESKPAGEKPMQQTSAGTAFTGQSLPPTLAGESVLAFKLSRDSEARVVFSGQVTQEAIDKLAALLNLSKDAYPTKEELDRPQPRSAMWRNKDHDQPVKVIGEAGEHDGRRYVKIEGSDAGVPEDELEYADAKGAA